MSAGDGAKPSRRRRASRLERFAARIRLIEERHLMISSTSKVMTMREAKDGSF